ncbi:MAG: outer membrane protein assembly factor BamE [Burkholderiales bacterium]
MGLLSLLLGLVACDAKRIAELEEGVSTEADVRAKFGQPDNVWAGAGGSQILEYNRQPAGARNYMITIGPDGRMSALRQVLTPENFAKVQPGMMMEDVRKLLGAPMKVTPYPLKRETHYEWRWLDGVNTLMIFNAIMDKDFRVVSTGSGRDPESPELKVK